MKKGPFPAAPHAAVEELPLFLRTISIDGKRMSPAIYKQIVEEEILDEKTVLLRGQPLGWFTVHGKECADRPSHTHVLWARDGALRIYPVLASYANDPRYKIAQMESRRYRDLLLDVFALLLAQKVRYSARVPLPGFPETKRRAELHVEYNNETLSFSISTGVYEQLAQLEAARVQYDADRKHLQQERPSDADAWLQQARAQLDQLVEGGARFTHPAFVTDNDAWGIPSEEDRILRAWVGRRDRTSPSEGIPWGQGQPPQGKDRAEEAQIEYAIHLYEIPLRVLLAEQIIERRLHQAQEHARWIAREIDETCTNDAWRPLSERAPDLSAQQIWAVYLQERQRFDGYTEAWKEICSQLQALPQLYVVS